jgi:hypothetical protein
MLRELDEQLKKNVEICYGIAEHEPEGAALLLSFLFQIAGPAYSRAIFLKLRQLDKKLNPSKEDLEIHLRKGSAGSTT